MPVFNINDIDLGAPTQAAHQIYLNARYTPGQESKESHKKKKKSTLF